jgi:hypothetical protein
LLFNPSHAPRNGCPIGEPSGPGVLVFAARVGYLRPAFRRSFERARPGTLWVPRRIPSNQECCHPERSRGSALAFNPSQPTRPGCPILATYFRRKGGIPQISAPDALKGRGFSRATNHLPKKQNGYRPKPATRLDLIPPSREANRVTHGGLEFITKQ